MSLSKRLILIPLLTVSLGHAQPPLPDTLDTHATFLENLAVPNPQATARLPAPLMTDNQWRGVYCGVTQEDMIIFRNENDWTLFWQKAMRPYSRHFETMPVIDFSKDMVVGVFWGEQRHPGFEVQITGTKKRIRREDQTEVLVVQYKKIQRPVGVFVPPLAVQPFHLKRQPRFPGPIYFFEVKK